MIDPDAVPLSVSVFRIAIAFGIGALIGLEREQSDSAGLFAGSRTFPLFALYGALVQSFFPAMLPIALLSVTVPLTVAYAGRIRAEGDIGLTTLVTALLTVVLGALATHSERGAVLAVVVAGAVTALLSAKGVIHRFADRIDERERRASIKFILVVLVVLPLVPDRELDALFGINPRYVWLMVVFVSGLSFVAYVLGRVIGVQRGIAVTGVLGGFVSSTATAVSMAERTTEEHTLYRIPASAGAVLRGRLRGGAFDLGVRTRTVGRFGDLRHRVRLRTRRRGRDHAHAEYARGRRDRPPGGRGGGHRDRGRREHPREGRTRVATRNTTARPHGDGRPGGRLRRRDPRRRTRVRRTAAVRMSGYRVDS